MKTFGALLFAVISRATALSIAEINGNRFISPYNGQIVSDVEGLVTAVSSSGIYLRSIRPDKDAATSESLFVYGSSAAKKVAVGDIVTLGGKVSEYR